MRPALRFNHNYAVAPSFTMGWFWGSSNNNSNPSSSDALSNLDPALREFLEKEAPRKRPPPPPQPTEASSIESLASHSLPKLASPAPTSQLTSSNAAVPAESLYQDGRYAHIWASYKPLADIEATGKTDQDKLTDLVDAFNNRKAAIGRAALENCAYEQLELSECFRSGGWNTRITMCKKENRRLARCFEMQSKFLKALGYLSLEGRSEEEEERIQMHADKLFHRMLAQEKEIEEAKKEGRLIPEFKPVMSKESIAAVLNADAPQTTTPTSSIALKDNLPTPPTPGRGESLNLEGLPERVRKVFEKRLQDAKSPEERALEERAIEAELAVTAKMGKEAEVVWAEERRKRQERQEQGRQTLGDRVKTFWGK